MALHYPQLDMKRIHVVIIVLVVGALAVIFWWWHNRSLASSNDQLLLFGNVDIRQVQLAFNGSERITSLLVHEGDRVPAGQLLGTLETRRFAAHVESARAMVAAQRQVVDRLEAGNRPQEIQKAKADLESAKADLRNSELNYNRVTNLVAQTVESQERLDSARAMLDVGRARLDSAKESYDLMVLGPRKEDIAAAKATLQADEAELVLAEQNLADSKLYAPTNGVIQNRILEPGDMASAQKPAFTLALTDPVWVRAYIAETDLGKVRLGMAASVFTDSFPTNKYEGWIGFISPTAEFTPKTVETVEVRTRLVYQIRVFVKNPRDELRLGMPATVRIPIDQPGSR